MGESTVLNKHTPPDFGPAKILRRKQSEHLQVKVRMMLPVSIRCNTCGNNMYKGTKFNSVEYKFGETDLGVQILRFLFKCSRCSAELTMKTDPQNSDYTMESGATRNLEPWRAPDEAVHATKSKRNAEEMGDAVKAPENRTDEAVDAAKSKRKAEDMGDAMEALENRTLHTKQGMDNTATLEEMKAMRACHGGTGAVEMLEALNKTREEKQKDLAEEGGAVLRSAGPQNSSNFVRRLDDDEFDDDVEDSPFKAEFEQQDKKRRKGESLEANNGDENGALQVANSLVEHNPETGDIGHPPGVKHGLVIVPIAVRPKPVPFSVQPKVSSSVAIEVKTNGETVTGKLSDGGDKTAVEENANGKAEVNQHKEISSASQSSHSGSASQLGC